MQPRNAFLLTALALLVLSGCAAREEKVGVGPGRNQFKTSPCVCADVPLNNLSASEWLGRS